MLISKKQLPYLIKVKINFFLKGKKALSHLCDWFSIAHLSYYACTMPTMPVLCLLCLYYAYYACTMPTMPVLCLLCLFITTPISVMKPEVRSISKKKKVITFLTSVKFSPNEKNLYFSSVACDQRFKRLFDNDPLQYCRNSLVISESSHEPH